MLLNRPNDADYNAERNNKSVLYNRNRRKRRRGRLRLLAEDEVEETLLLDDFFIGVYRDTLSKPIYYPFNFFRKMLLTLVRTPNNILKLINQTNWLIYILLTTQILPINLINALPSSPISRKGVSSSQSFSPSSSSSSSSSSSVNDNNNNYYNDHYYPNNNDFGPDYGFVGFDSHHTSDEENDTNLPILQGINGEWIVFLILFEILYNEWVERERGISLWMGVMSFMFYYSQYLWMHYHLSKRLFSFLHYLKFGKKSIVQNVGHIIHLQTRNAI